MGLRLSQGEGEGISFLSSLVYAPRADSRTTRAKGENYLLEVDNPVVVPVGKKVRVSSHRQRRDPRLVGARLGSQAGRHSRLRARYLVQRGKARHLSRPVRRAMRQGARLHADRRGSGGAGEIRPVGRASRRRNLPRRRSTSNKVFTADELKAEGEKVYATNCVACHQANGMGIARHFSRAGGIENRHRSQGRAYQHRYERQDRHRDGGFQASVGCRNRGGGHLRAQFLGQYSGRHGAAIRNQRTQKIASRRKPWQQYMITIIAHAHDHHPSGMMRWVTTTNHKDIGTMYLWFSFIMFLTGGVMALTIRAELFQPGLQIVNPDSSTSLPRCMAWSWCSAPSCRPSSASPTGRFR